MSANDRQVGGNHYKDMTIQPWDAMEAWSTRERMIGYHKNVSIAYLARDKGDELENIKKAHHHLEKLIEYMEKHKEQSILDMKSHFRDIRLENEYTSDK